MSGELVFKIILTLFFSVFYLGVVSWVWTHQLDPVATIKKFIQKTVEGPSWVVTRDPNKLYQGSEVVGDVTGPITKKSGAIHFSQLANTSNLKQTQEFQYQKLVLKIQRVGLVIGSSSQAIQSDDGARSRVLSAVLEDVDCIIIR